LRPEKLAPFILKGEYVSISSVRKWLETVMPGASIRIVLEKSATPSNDRYRKLERIRFDQCLDDWIRPHDLIVAAGSSSSHYLDAISLGPSLPSLPEHSLGFASWSGEQVPCSLAAWVVEVAAERWNMAPQELLSTCKTLESNVGQLRDGTLMNAEYLLVTRPARPSIKKTGRRRVVKHRSLPRERN
jgi:hypothetical protein